MSQENLSVEIPAVGLLGKEERQWQGVVSESAVIQPESVASVAGAVTSPTGLLTRVFETLVRHAA